MDAITEKCDELSHTKENSDLIPECHVKNGEVMANGKSGSGKSGPETNLFLGPEFRPGFISSFSRIPTDSKGYTSKSERHAFRGEASQVCKLMLQFTIVIAQWFRNFKNLF